MGPKIDQNNLENPNNFFFFFLHFWSILAENNIFTWNSDENHQNCKVFQVNVARSGRWPTNCPPEDQVYPRFLPEFYMPPKYQNWRFYAKYPPEGGGSGVVFFFDNVVHPTSDFTWSKKFYWLEKVFCRTNLYFSEQRKLDLRYAPPLSISFVQLKGKRKSISLFFKCSKSMPCKWWSLFYFIYYVFLYKLVLLSKFSFINYFWTFSKLHDWRL